jgi:uncharacterized membrane protein YebE (DUF533 family)
MSEFEDFTREERIIFCRAMANIIASDRKVTEDETNELEGLIIGTGLSPSDPEVRAAVEKELKAPGSLSEIVKELKKKDLQAALFRMLIEASCADGEIATEERQKVSEAARAFGLNPSAASELIDWTLQSLKHEKREREILARLG